ncbi:MAG TPA: hypothetical protein PKI89_09005, partial [Tepidiformaceae bacterium]|nr:hypothetical protein [Tepidiformaceae bacterium]
MAAYADSKGQETRSEAVLLESASTDGQLAFTLRLCRYPELGISWLWGHVFAGGRVYVFADHTQPCDRSVTNLDTDSVVYAHGAGTAPAFRFERMGPLLGPSLGGYLIEVLDWHWIFLVNVPLGVMASALAWRHIREPDWAPAREP